METSFRCFEFPSKVTGTVLLDRKWIVVQLARKARRRIEETFISLNSSVLYSRSQKLFLGMLKSGSFFFKETINRFEMVMSSLRDALVRGHKFEV
jgi:hypothetical protein